MNSGLTFPLAEKIGGAQRARRRRHAQLRLVVHRRGGADRHRRPLHHAGSRTARSTRAPGTASSPCCASRGRAGRSTACCSRSTSRTCCSRRRPSASDHAATLRARLQELHEKLGVRSPVYVLVTKADLLAGFNEIFGALDKEERDQVWGFTFPLRADQRRRPAASTSAPSSPRSRSACATGSCRCMDAEHEVLKRAAHLQLPAAVRRPARPAAATSSSRCSAPAARSRSGRCCAASTSPAARRKARRSTACWARWRAPSASSAALPPPAGRARQELLPPPPAQGRGLQRAGAGRREPGDGAAPRGACASPASRSCCC